MTGRAEAIVPPVDPDQPVPRPGLMAGERYSATGGVERITVPAEDTQRPPGTRPESGPAPDFPPAERPTPAP